MSHNNAHYLQIIAQAHQYWSLVHTKLVAGQPRDAGVTNLPELHICADAAYKTALSLLPYDMLPPQFQQDRFPLRYRNEFQSPVVEAFGPEVPDDFGLSAALAKPSRNDFRFASDEDVAYAVEQGWIHSPQDIELL